MRRTTLQAAVAVLAGVPAMVGLAAPAQAFAAPAFSAVDVSTPGHARVAVSTDAPYVVAWLRSTTHSVRVTEPVFVPTANGEAAFDLETWGVDSAQVMARACADTAFANCDPIVLSGTFVPSDAAPSITWPGDDTVGAADVYSPDVADPEGGGLLVAVWKAERTVLDPGAAVALPLASDGAGSITVQRCSALAPTLCRSSGVTHEIEVNRVLEADGQLGPRYVNPDTAPLILQLHTLEGPAQTYTFDWQVADTAGVVVPGVGGIVENLIPDADGRFQAGIDVSALPDGLYSLVGRLAYTDPDFGEVGRHLDLGQFVIDRAAPAIATITFSSPSLYPYRDGFHDTVAVFFGGAENNTTARVRVTNADGLLLKKVSRSVQAMQAKFFWDGKDSSGTVVPAGTYTISADAVDAAGNQSVARTWTVTVKRQRLAWTTFNHTYPAVQTLDQVHVGSCSAVVKPSSYPWKGSIELRSASKCYRSGAPAVAETVHSVLLPAGTFVTGSVVLSVYGASTIDRMSEAKLFVRNGSGTWRAPRIVDQFLGWHPFDLDNVRQLLGTTQRLTWRVRLDRHQDKYALGSFKVQFSGGYLVAE